MRIRTNCYILVCTYIVYLYVVCEWHLYVFNSANTKSPKTCAIYGETTGLYSSCMVIHSFPMPEYRIFSSFIQPSLGTQCEHKSLWTSFARNKLISCAIQACWINRSIRLNLNWFFMCAIMAIVVLTCTKTLHKHVTAIYWKIIEN